MGWNTKESKVNIDKVKKILVIELWGIGDIVLAVPALKAIRTYFPGAEVTLLAKGHSKELLKNSRIVDRIVVFDFPWTRHTGKYRFWEWDIRRFLNIIRNLRKERFDLVLDARMDFRNNLLMWLVGAKRRIGYNLTGGGYFLTNIVPIDYTKQHRVDEWANLLKFLGVEGIDFSPRLWISEDESKWADKFLADNKVSSNDLVIGIHPGAGIKKRCWPLERFGKVAEYVRNRYNAKIIIFIEPDGYGKDIPVSGHSIRVKLTLRELISVINKLNFFICNDGGPMHMATAVSTPVVAIFGPGDLDAMGPYGDEHRVVIKDRFPCRPCYDYCKFKEPYCLTEISVEDVIKAVDEKLSRVPVSR